MKPLQPEDFWQRVDRSDPEGCWPWTKGVDGHGYGTCRMTRWTGRRCKVRAHRMAWRLTYGPIPDGVLVLHKCDNPPCCNPAHLYLGTTQDNSDDMVRRNRNHKKNYIRKNLVDRGRWKLWPDQVEEIFAKRQAGARNKDLAAEYGISAAMVTQIAQGGRWKRLKLSAEKNFENPIL